MINKLLSIIIPNQIKRKIYSSYLSKIKENNKRKNSHIPKFAIQHETIENTKLLLCREDLLKVLPKHGIVAELGVDEGNFSESILKINDPDKLILLDSWASERYNQNKRKDVEEKFDSQIKSGKVEIEIGLSTDLGKKFQDNYFDWIYIDTDHGYQVTINELKIWEPKIKENGIIAGHDFIVGNWDNMVRYGVIEAVYEFCSKYKWEILYLTMEHNTSSSFAIRKIKLS